MLPIEKFGEIANLKPGSVPNDMQKAMWKHITGDDCAVLLRSPTGSGKTEAVLIPSLASERRLFMIFPARSLVEDQIGRIVGILNKLSNKGKQYALVVDTGGQSQRRVFLKGEEITDQQFNSRRHLYDGNVIITTLDKFLYRFFGFGDERKGYIFPFRIFRGLKRNLFVFDEAHAYEDTAFTNFLRLIKALYVAHLDIVLMTATMPKSYAGEFNFLDLVDYLGMNKPFPKKLSYLPTERSQLVERIVVEAQAREMDSKRLIVIVETVEDAVLVWRRLSNAMLYHGRLDNAQRKKVYAELKRRETAGEGYTLVTTSAIEVGCDLNADYLITEICNPANLIQRAGRCNRRGDRENAEVVVVGSEIKDFLREISEENEQILISRLQEKSGAEFIADDYLDLTQRSIAFDYRAEIMFDMLFEYVYDGRLENKPLHDRGLVVTRSWEPSVTLTTNRETMSHAISVPISRCAAWQDADWQKDIKIYVRYFNRYGNEYETVLKPLEYGGCAYFRDLVIEVPQDDFSYEKEVGYLNIPKPFKRWRPDGYRETLAFLNTEGKTRTIYYLHWKPELSEPQTTKAITENDSNDASEQE